MKMNTRKLSMFFMIWVLIFLGIYAVHAQESHISASAGIVGFSNAGTASSAYPLTSIEFAARASDRLVFVNSAWLHPYRKIETGDGWKVGELACLRVYPASYFFVEPGAMITHYSTSRWAKTAVLPSVGTGFNYRNRVIPEVIYSFRDMTSMNHITGLLIGCQTYHPLLESKRWGLQTTIRLWVVRFDQAPVGRITGSDFHLAIGLYRTF